jgi:AcrR family transcriptional regulator
LTAGQSGFTIKPNERLFFMLATPKTPRPSRIDNRLPDLLNAAAFLFAHQGYAGTSMRDIAEEAKMLAGSVYYHFPSKDELLLAVYTTGVQALEAAASLAVARESDPWQRLEALCRAHLDTVLRNSDYAQVLVRVHPEDIPRIAPQLRELRRNHERFFRDAIAALPLPAGTDRRSLRLMLIGALNWVPVWFSPKGRDTPRALARQFVGMIKERQDAETPATCNRHEDRL